MRALPTIAALFVALCINVTSLPDAGASVEMHVCFATDAIPSIVRTGSFPAHNTISARHLTGSHLCTNEVRSRTDVTVISATEKNATPDYGFGRLFPPSFFRAARIVQGSAFLSAVILLALIMWVFASAVSSASIDVLKRRLAILAWVCLPPALTYMLFVVVSGSFLASFTQIILPLLWVQVFAALCVAGVSRRWLSGTDKSPDLLSIPFATLVFVMIVGIVLYLFIEYGTIQEPADCSSTLESPFSICGYFAYDGFYFGGALILALVLVGIFIPADSNLVRANDWLALCVMYHYTRARNAIALYRNQRREQRQREEQEWPLGRELEDPDLPAGSSSFPLPAIVERPSFEAMCLKLRRSQRSGLTGNRIFALDARIELTAEERSLVEKYQLGNAVIYDSVSRQRHTAAMLAHAEATRDQPSLYAGPVTQLLGLGKTLYRLSRAGVSATAAALSLRLTIHSLMRGVHVECKSMEELLAAESAVLEGARNLKFYLETAATFDGREEIVEL